MALDSLAVLDTEFKKLDKQVKENNNYESEWSYSQLVNCTYKIHELLLTKL